LEQFEDLWRTPGSDQQASLSGTVHHRTAQPGTRAVLPALERVAERHPGITLDVRLSDRISNG
jgi:DNA-binding transcriptional LysR family regulator